MRNIVISIMFLLVLSVNSFGAIAFDAVSEDSVGADIASASWSHTVGTLDHGILIVVAALRDGGLSDPDITGITYNSVALTKVRADEHTNSCYSIYLQTEIWYLLNPSSGSNTIEVTFTGTVNEVGLAAISLSGVDPDNPIEASGSEASPDQCGSLPTDSDTAVTTLTYGDYLVDVMYNTETYGPSTADDGQTTLADLPVNGGGDEAMAGYRMVTTPGTYQQGWTWGGTGAAYLASIAAVKPLRRVMTVQ